MVPSTLGSTPGESRGEGSGSLRDRTTEEVFRHIRSGQGDITRTGLVELTGYPSSTIRHAVAKLLASGRVVESQAVKATGGGAGRPAASLAAVPGESATGGIAFGHSHVRVAVGDDLGNIVDEAVTRLDVDHDPTASMDIACSTLASLVERSGSGPLALVVAGVPGPVDAITGRVRSSTILPGWSPEQDPGDYMTERLGAPLVVENDANLGAWGELHRGAGRGYSDFLYVKVSQGVGAAIVMDGEVRRGASGLAGELGHISVPGRSDPCRCGGSGCVEAVMSERAVRSSIEVTHPHLDAEQVDLSTLNDPVAVRIFSECGLVLGRVLADAANILNPAAIVIGGTLSTVGPAFLDGIRSSLSAHAQPAIVEGLGVKRAANGTRAELVGAMTLAGLRVGLGA